MQLPCLCCTGHTAPGSRRTWQPSSGTSWSPYTGSVRGMGGGLNLSKKKILMISLSPLRSQRMAPGKNPEHHSEEDRESQPIQTFTIPET